MKYVPNTLTMLRIILSALLLLLTLLGLIPALGLVFLLIYTIAGITDMIDGPIARKFDVTTKYGANFDGIADYCFLAAALVTIIPALEFYPRTIALVAGIIAVKVIGMIVGYIHYKQLMMMHTYMSKIGALFAFLFPPLFFAINLITSMNENTLLTIIICFAYLFLLEEIAINIVMPVPKRDIKGIAQAVRIRKDLKAGN